MHPETEGSLNVERQVEMTKRVPLRGLFGGHVEFQPPTAGQVEGGSRDIKEAVNGIVGFQGRRGASCGIVLNHLCQSR